MRCGNTSSARLGFLPANCLREEEKKVKSVTLSQPEPESLEGALEEVFQSRIQRKSFHKTKFVSEKFQQKGFPQLDAVSLYGFGKILQGVQKKTSGKV